MTDRAGQAIEPDHDQGLARPDLPEQPRQHRPAAVGAGRVLFEDGGATGGAQLVGLRIGALVLRGHAGVADQAGG